MRSGLLELRLSNFRSYKTLCLKTDEALSPVVLTGANGVGKTNILEAISFLTPGRGLRQARLSDIPTRNTDDAIFAEQDADMPAWAVSAKVQTPDGIVQVGTGKDSSSEKRQIRIDGENAKMLRDFLDENVGEDVAINVFRNAY